MQRIATAFAVLLLLTIPVYAADSAEPLPTAEDLHKMFSDKQYAPLLLKITRLLQLKGDAAKTYDHVDLWLLKGETHLQLKQQSLAMPALASAVKEITDRTDAKEANTARATEILVKRSRVFQFTPKYPAQGQPVKPISILDLDQRKACFTAMLEDSKTELAAKVKTAKSSTTLQPIIEAVKAVADLRTLEMAALGTDDLAAPYLDSLAAQGQDLMSRGVKDLQSREETINKKANQLITMPGNTTAGGAQRSNKRGLDPQGTKDLKDIEAEAERVVDAAKQFADLSKTSAAAFATVRDSADTVAKAAKATLEADYRGTTTLR